MSTTAVMYGVMGFASLSEATDGLSDAAALHANALSATRTLADYMMAQQSHRETNFGYCKWTVARSHRVYTRL
eukprot:COSAG04_NODE_15923_length_515_cov_1.824519_2_plen_73_part_01